MATGEPCKAETSLSRSQVRHQTSNWVEGYLSYRPSPAWVNHRTLNTSSSVSQPQWWDQTLRRFKTRISYSGKRREWRRIMATQSTKVRTKRYKSLKTRQWSQRSPRGANVLNHSRLRCTRRFRPSEPGPSINKAALWPNWRNSSS